MVTLVKCCRFYIIHVGFTKAQLWAVTVSDFKLTQLKSWYFRMYSFLQLKLNSKDDVFLACAEPDPASERGGANGGFHIFKIFLLIDPKNYK